MDILETKVSSLDQVPAELQKYYSAQQDGSFSLSISGADKPPAPKAPPSPAKPQTSLTPDLQAQLDELKEYKAREEQARLDSLRKNGDFDKIKESIEKKHNEIMAQKDAQFNELRQKHESALIQRAIVESISSNGGDVELLSPHLYPHVKVINDRVVVVDENGSPRITNKGGSSDPMSVSEFVETNIKTNQKFMKLFTGTDASGAGSKPEPSKIVGTITKKSDFKGDIKLKCQYIEKHGQKAFNALPE